MPVPIRGAGMPEAAQWDQDTFRFRDSVRDPSSEDAAFDAGDSAAGTDYTWVVGTDSIIRVRFLIQQTHSIADTNLAPVFELRYSYNSGVYTEVPAQATASVPIRAVAGAPTDSADINTQLLGAGSFVTGVGGYRENGTGMPTGTQAFTSGALSESEYEFALEVVTGQVSNNDTIDLRMYVDNNQALDTYTDTPRITVSVVGGSLVQRHPTSRTELFRRAA